MRVCNGCGKPIAMGTLDIIEVRFFGKFSDNAKKIFGSDSLDFDSLFCMTKLLRESRPTKKDVEKRRF